MQLYLYAKSGHNFGLENIRRASAVYDMLREQNPLLCTADYRAATFAKSELDVDKGVGIDVIGNLPHVMERGDMLIYDDSGEASDTMQTYMKDYCRHIYKIGKDIPFDIVDDCFFEKREIQREKVIFFSDDDYSNWFFDLVQKSDTIDTPLLWGHYFFLQNEEKLSKKFTEVIEEDEYKETIQTTKYLLTSSIHSCLESLAAGNNPVYFKRMDKENIENYELLEKYNIPTIEIENVENFELIIEKFEKIMSEYPTLESIEKFDISAIQKEISETLKLFEMVQPSLDYKL